MMNCLACCMAFNIWYLVVLKARFTERKLVKWYCLFSVMVPLVATCVAVVLLRDQPYFSAFPRQFYCNLADGAVTRGTFAGPMFAVAIPGILFSLHTAIYLVQHYVFVRKTLVLTLTPTSHVVIEPSHCIRLLVFCFSIGIVVIMAVLQALVEPKTSENQDITPTPTPAADANQQDNSHRNLVMFSEFSGSLVGFFAFLIFGTTHDAFETLRGVVCCWRVRGCCGRGGGGWEEYWRSSSSRSRNGQDVGDAIYYCYKDDENVSQDTTGGNDGNDHVDDDGISYSRNYTELYLGNNNNDDLGAYRYPTSDTIQLNNNTFGRQFRINNNASSGHSEGNSNTTFATTTPTTNTITTVTSMNTQNNSNSKNRKTMSASSSRRMSIVGPIPPPPLRPLPEKPTFQELMMYDFYHTDNNNNNNNNNKNNNNKNDNYIKKNKRSNRRRRSNDDNDLESGLASDLLQPPPPSPPSLLPPPRAVYSPR
ncbi:MAG: hypothetical protein JOS17DRAFT_744905 [Linnemannia elongata]|nr:MAG: hypothetical protein JOS17DRAFT_744905 [Linnemannia elongata]